MIKIVPVLAIDFTTWGGNVGVGSVALGGFAFIKTGSVEVIPLAATDSSDTIFRYKMTRGFVVAYFVEVIKVLAGFSTRQLGKSS